MSGFLGSVPNFDPSTQDWQIFASRLKQFLGLNSIDTEAKKRAVLLTHLSDEAYRLLKNLAHPKEVETEQYDELIKLLNGHFAPKRSTFSDKAKFYNAVKAEGEKVEDWAARLRGLAVHCEFGTALEMMLRDRFVLGFHAGPERDRLCEQDVDKLTFAKALELAQQAACARQAKAASVVFKEEPLFRTSTTRSGSASRGGRGDRGGHGNRPASSADFSFRCTVCGLRNHEAERCKFKNYRCQKCHKKGHLKKVCKSTRVHNIGMGPSSSNAQEPEDCSDCEECQLFNLRCVNYDPIVIPVVLNKSVKLDMELDSGSSMNVIGHTLFTKYFSGIPLEKCNIKMCFYNGHKITPVGRFAANVTYRNRTKQLTFYVVHNGANPLLGREFMVKFQISFTSENYNISVMNSVDSEVKSLLDNYEKLFREELGCFNKFEVNLYLKDGVKPKFFKPRPLPFALKSQVENELSRLTREGILVPVNYSDYATPIVPVLKQNGSVRICGDYSLTVNKDIYIDKYPLPRIDDIFNKLSGGKHYSKLDCSQAYNQLVLTKESQKLTTINTTKGLFMYTRLVFGLANAPAVFQRAIENLLAGIEGVAVFLDDVCVTGATKSEHLSRLKLVFERFQDAGMRLQKNKCAFFQNSVTYLGHIIDKKGLHKCPRKVDAIVKVPRPNNIKELKSFLGLVNYYRNFVANASSLLCPLHELLRSDTEWQWTPRHEAAFEQMKRELASERALAHFDPNARLVLSVDAGPAGLGAVLSQVGADGVERPLAYGSRALTASEINYSQLHKEATAIVFGVKRFHQYLYGRSEPFILKTDHKPLLAIFGKKNGISVMTASRLVRYAIFLSAYNYVIQYISGNENLVADYFSRACPMMPVGNITATSSAAKQCNLLTVNALQLSNLSPLTYRDIQTATATDKTLATVSKYIQLRWPRRVRCTNIGPYFRCRNDLEMEKGCLMRGHRVIIPKLLRSRLLQELHKSHLGIVKTKSNARARMWWPGIDRDIEQLIGACTVCSALRAAPPRAPPASWSRPPGPWHRIHVDYMMVAQRTYLIVVDAYSKWVECVDMTGGTSTKRLIAELMLLFWRFGLPESIVSDNDTKIASQEFVNFCQMSGINYITSPIYHPISNGLAEVAVRNCKKMVKSIIEQESQCTSLSHKLQSYLFEYRTTIHCTTGVTPAKLMFGRELRSRLDLIVPPRGKTAVSVHTSPPPPAQVGRQARTFCDNEDVWVKCFQNRKPYWARGKIIKKIGSRMYLVNLESHNISCRRHVDQILRYTNNNSSISDGINDVVLTSPGSSTTTSTSLNDTLDVNCNNENNPIPINADSVNKECSEEKRENAEAVDEDMGPERSMPANDSPTTGYESNVAATDTSSASLNPQSRYQLRPRSKINYKF